MESAVIQSLQQLLGEWAATRGLSVSVLAAELAGGFTLNVTVMSDSTYALLYQQYADALGYPIEALGSELTLESGECVVLLGLDPVGEVPLLIVQSGEHRFHLPKAVFDKAWHAR